MLFLQKSEALFLFFHGRFKDTAILYRFENNLVSPLDMLKELLATFCYQHFQHVL